MRQPGKYDAQRARATWEVSASGSHWKRSTFGIARGNEKPALQIELVQSKNSASFSLNVGQISPEDTKRDGDGCIDSIGVGVGAIMK